MCGRDKAPGRRVRAPTLSDVLLLHRGERDASRQQTNRGRGVGRSLGLSILGLGFAAVTLPDAWGPIPASSKALAQENEIIAAQIRKQGFACEKPARAERQSQRSKPNETVWVLKCGNATYRVRLVPKMAADIERVE